MLQLFFISLFISILYFPFAHAQEEESPFEVLAASADFELVAIEPTDPLADDSGGTRCFIRSKASGQRPALMIYPGKQRWGVTLPSDVANAANWEQKNVKGSQFYGLPVSFRFQVDETMPVLHTEQIYRVNIHKRRYIFVPETDQRSLLRRMQQGTALHLSWRHENLGSAVEELTRDVIGEPQAPTTVSYNLSGLGTLMADAPAKCPL